MAERAYGGCAKYIQRDGELDRIGQHAATLGTSALLIVDGFILERYGERLHKSFSDAGVEAAAERFGGECWTGEVERLSEIARQNTVQMIVGVGGGKTVDTAKLVAMEFGLRLIIVPTIASSDAPTSAIAMRYHENGSTDRSVYLPRHPDFVIIDPKVVIEAPVRFLVAGMGDALTTWYEARANRDAGTKNYIAGGYRAPIAGLAIARQCHETLMNDGRAAKIAAENGRLTPAVQNIIEANTLLSGLGFENCGCSIAHGFHNGMSILPETHSMLHGEKAAYGVLVLLVMEGRPNEEIEEAFSFCEDIGLPTTLADLGLGNTSDDDLARGARAALGDNEPTHSTTAELSVESLLAAIYTVDALGRKRRETVIR
ncbi:glycerol dehydrogenase [Aquamicrobium segne]|uniref:Glycerol dehydrogenase n=1 Tax=Aquamicrobium segne TaxID=469547 RepID=A0ABW0H2A0_9HYPH